MLPLLLLPLAAQVTSSRLVDQMGSADGPPSATHSPAFLSPLAAIARRRLDSTRSKPSESPLNVMSIDRLSSSDTETEGEAASPRKILFLDVDGVLHPHTDFGISERMFRAHCMRELKRIVDETGCDIVFSSSWRNYKANCALASDKLLSHGVPMWISATPSISFEQRSLEVSRWLEANPSVDRYVILDDIDFSFDDPNFVKTDPRTGLTSEDADRAIAILNGDRNIL
ncbi:unnamed protein product [Vitrella brassicaformis CCMP3155]|uniref:FCP1 homology domain-containing protein n=2 Tax=Vitrella brassicaformis TaxID=1169539 RepID=A0A0G4GRZ6_VITBC|nr:unnamed protein product [Vitrella brassicaformis CCMP3155]|mmetsp:Transcript_21801/g.53430  ORF Transcript_21801/g.53430 Transcript_21801/m.53430 type:complete len:228 (+) Transcript_21801:73-756(+)|eukprot:CEM33400.1 unnamed protein product [Vitrella brassicaformis CCMP3155]